MSPLFFSLILPFKQHPVLTGYVVLVWSGLVQIQSRSQSRVCFVVECWSVREAARCSLSVWGVLTEVEQHCLHRKKGSDSCLKSEKKKFKWWKQFDRLRQGRILQLREQTAAPPAPCVISCLWMRSSVVTVVDPCCKHLSCKGVVPFLFSKNQENIVLL